jgi:hypothetical protein
MVLCPAWHKLKGYSHGHLGEFWFSHKIAVPTHVSTEIEICNHDLNVVVIVVELFIVHKLFELYVN